MYNSSGWETRQIVSICLIVSLSGVLVSGFLPSIDHSVNVSDCDHNTSAESPVKWLGERCDSELSSLEGVALPSLEKGYLPCPIVN